MVALPYFFHAGVSDDHQNFASHKFPPFFSIVNSPPQFSCLNIAASRLISIQYFHGQILATKQGTRRLPRRFLRFIHYCSQRQPYGEVSVRLEQGLVYQVAWRTMYLPSLATRQRADSRRINIAGACEIEEEKCESQSVVDVALCSRTFGSNCTITFAGTVVASVCVQQQGQSYLLAITRQRSQPNLAADVQ